MRDTAAVLPVDDKMVIVCRRGEIEEAFRHPDIFSSNMWAVDLQNVRPLIPLQIDPPDHSEVPQDPRPAVRAAPHGGARGAGRGAGARPHRPSSTAASRLLHRVLGSVASHVFLTLLGLPLADPTALLDMKDGIIRPDHVVGKRAEHADTLAYQNDIGGSIYAYFDARARRARGRAPRRPPQPFLDTEVDGHQLTREDILDICFLFLIAGLDTVSASLDCFFGYLARAPRATAAARRRPVALPSAVEELLRWESPVSRRPRRHRDTELLGCPIKEGDMVSICLGSTDTDEAAFADAYEVRFDREPNRHPPSAVGSIAASARTSPAANYGSRCGSGIAGSPTTR